MGQRFTLPSLSNPFQWADMARRTESLDIIIVGAGLGGLAASIECALSGHSVTVLESAQELAEVRTFAEPSRTESVLTHEQIGAGLQITPNSSRLLKGWGVYEKLQSQAVEPTSLVVHRFSGTILAKEDEFDKRIKERYGSPFTDLHRVDLQQALVARARELGVTLRLGQRVASLDLDAVRPRILTTSGTEYICDLVVGADGLWSKCRECFLGRKDQPLPTGDLAYRIVLELDQIKDPELREMVTKPSVHFWIGPDSHVVAYSLKDCKQYNIVLLVPDDLPESVARQQGSVEEMQKLFQGWDPILTRFLECVNKVDKWKLMHRESPKQKWRGTRLTNGEQANRWSHG